MLGNVQEHLSRCVEVVPTRMLFLFGMLKKFRKWIAVVVDNPVIVLFKNAIKLPVFFGSWHVKIKQERLSYQWEILRWPGFGLTGPNISAQILVAAGTEPCCRKDYTTACHVTAERVGAGKQGWGPSCLCCGSHHKPQPMSLKAKEFEVDCVQERTWGRHPDSKPTLTCRCYCGPTWPLSQTTACLFIRDKRDWRSNSAQMFCRALAYRTAWQFPSEPVFWDATRSGTPINEEQRSSVEESVL